LKGKCCRQNVCRRPSLSVALSKTKYRPFGNENGGAYTYTNIQIGFVQILGKSAVRLASQV